jgi:hypothetical protein
VLVEGDRGLCRDVAIIESLGLPRTDWLLERGDGRRSRDSRHGRAGRIRGSRQQVARLQWAGWWIIVLGGR